MSYAHYLRTVIVFTDVPKHIEFRVSDWPLLDEGVVIEMDVELKNPKDPSRVRKIQGEYVVEKKRNKHSSKSGSTNGFTQYLEMGPVEKK